jgi:hypothetical protein
MNLAGFGGVESEMFRNLVMCGEGFEIGEMLGFDLFKGSEENGILILNIDFSGKINEDSES